MWPKIFFACCLIFLIGDISGSENNSDKYITSSKSECFTSRNLFSCIKYKTARFIWSVAVGQVQLIRNSIDGEHINLVRIPNNGKDTEFMEYRSETDISETSKALSFLKRSFEMFLTTHGFQITFGKDSGARLISDTGSDDLLAENRGKKKRKLQLILPLIILFKMIKLKVMLIKVLLGIGVIQLLLVAGGLFLFHYFKHNTLCKFQGHPVHSHSHVVESDTEPYASYAGYHYSHPSLHTSATYAKDWANNRAYGAFNNYMDSHSTSS